MTRGTGNNNLNQQSETTSCGGLRQWLARHAALAGMGGLHLVPLTYHTRAGPILIAETQINMEIEKRKKRRE